MSDSILSIERSTLFNCGSKQNHARIVCLANRVCDIPQDLITLPFWHISPEAFACPNRRGVEFNRGKAREVLRLDALQLAGQEERHAFKYGCSSKDKVSIGGIGLVSRFVKV